MKKDEAIKNLEKGEDEERIAAALCIEQAAMRGADIKALVPKLAKALADRNPMVRMNAAAALACAAKQEQDIFAAVPALLRAIHDDVGPVRDNARRALKTLLHPN